LESAEARSAKAEGRNAPPFRETAQYASSRLRGSKAIAPYGNKLRSE
jgi:hypothetical protein